MGEEKVMIFRKKGWGGNSKGRGQWVNIGRFQPARGNCNGRKKREINKAKNQGTMEKVA